MCAEHKEGDEALAREGKPDLYSHLSDNGIDGPEIVLVHDANVKIFRLV